MTTKHKKQSMGWFRHHYSEWQYDVDIAIEDGERHPRLAVTLYWLRWSLGVSWLLRKVATKVCKIRGHKLEDQSSAGPDSGNADYGCSRCGEQWDVPLY